MTEQQVSFDIEIHPSLKVNNKVVEYVSDDFLELIGYEVDDIIHKNIKKLTESLLKLTVDLDSLEGKSGKLEGFLFTKSLKAREVIITKHQHTSDEIETLVFKEKPQSRLEDKFPFVEKLYLDNYLGVAIFATTPDITLMRANQTFLEFFHYPNTKEKNIIGKRIHELVDEWKDSSIEKMWNDVLTTGKPFYSHEYRYNTLDKGRTTYCKVTLMPIKENNRIKYVIEIAENITNCVSSRKQTEEQALILNKQKQELERLIKLKDEFLTIISHEFKTPLNVINSAVQALDMICTNELSNTAKGFINKIRQNTFRQLRLVNNILDMTRMNSGRHNINKENVDIVFLTRAIVESVQLYAEEKSITLDFFSSLKEAIIALDEEKYERILLNLLSNAIKYTPKGKRITLKLFNVKDLVCIEIQDEGIGIPIDKQELIFERFGQVNSSLSRQAEGTGVGLSLVKMLVEVHGGSISLMSEEGKGSIFLISLPMDKIDESIDEESGQVSVINDDRLVQSIKIEFSDIYLI